MRWEQFLDLLTVAEVMLFIFGRLLMSGSASAPGGARGPDMHSEVSGAGKKNQKKKPARCPRTGGAHSLSFTLQFLLWDSVPTTHSSSIRLLSSLPCLLSPSILSIFFFPNLIFSPSTAPPAPPPQHTHTPSHPSPDSHIHLLSSQHILACYCFSLRFGRPVFTNGLLPADQCFRYSCTNYRRSKMESSRAE